MIKKSVVAAAVLAVLTACDTTDPRVPAAIQVDPASVTLLAGETVTVEAMVVDQQGRPYDEPPVGFEPVWTSLDPDVAEAQAGVIMGLSTGQTIVQVEAGDLPAAEIQVVVEGDLHITGSFDLPIISEDDPDALVVDAQLSFSYTGHREGDFDVDATFALGEIDEEGSYAFSFYNLEFDDQDFVGWELRADGRLDYIEFYVDQAVETPGEVAAYLGFVFIGFDPVADTVEDVYILHPEAEEGVVTVTAATGERVAGTFQMTMAVDLEMNQGEIAADPAQGQRLIERTRRSLR